MSKNIPGNPDWPAAESRATFLSVFAPGALKEIYPHSVYLTKLSPKCVDA